MKKECELLLRCKCKNEFSFYLDKIELAFGLLDETKIICNKCGKNNISSYSSEFIFMDEEILRIWA